jgi:hypothetical protein
VELLFIRRFFIGEFRRHVREDSGNRLLSLKRLLLGNLERVALLGILKDR